MTPYRTRLSSRFTPRIFAALCLFLSLVCIPARADVALLLEQPYGKLGIFNPAGHSAIYLDHVCAETPLVLRMCRAGELGVVLSRYDGIGTYDWVAMPLLPYLYSVDTADQIPAFVTHQTEDDLRDAYRRKYLEAIAPDVAGGAAPGGNWYELLGSSFDRTIYGFKVVTTRDQDEDLVALFNDRRNVERYNGAFINCADFARVLINRYYPHAVRRNLIADFGITSPKSVARSLAHYAAKHPETHLKAFVIPQVKGDLPRSHPAACVSESLLKKYGLPMAVLSPEVTAAVFVAYVGQGRFAMPKDAPLLLNISEMQMAEMKAAGSKALIPVTPLGVTTPAVLTPVAVPSTGGLLGWTELDPEP